MKNNMKKKIINLKCVKDKKKWYNLEKIKGLFKQKFNNKHTLNDFIIWTRHDANSIWNELRVQRHNLHRWD